MDAETIKALFIEHLPTIINYGLTIIAYIFVFIYRFRFMKTKIGMTISFNERVSFAEKKADAARKEYEVAKQKLDDIRVTYERRIARLESTIKTMLEVEDNGDSSGEQESKLCQDGNNRTSSSNDTVIEERITRV